MYKRLPTIGLCLFFFTASLIIYFSYQIYCNISINEMKSNIITAQKAWNNYFYLTNKINLTDLKNFSSETTLLTSLNDLNSAIKESNEEEVAKQSKTIEAFAKNKIVSKVDLITLYNSEGIQVTGFTKNNENLPDIYLPEALNEVLKGQKLSINLNVNGDLYYSNIAPIIFNGKTIGAMLVGKKIDNSLSAYIQDISSSDLIVFSKEKLLAASLPYLTDKDIYKENKTVKALITDLLNTSDPTKRNKIEYIQLPSGDFWAAGKYIAGQTGGYVLLTANTKWIKPYLFIKKYFFLFFLGLIALSAGMGTLTHKVLNSIFATLILKTAETREVFNARSKKVVKKFELYLDIVLNKILQIFNIEFFSTNQEIQDLSNNLKSMISDYKEKVAAENFAEEKKIGYMINPAYKTGCSVTTRKTTLYYSNIKNFNDLIDFYSPSRAFTVLSIYLQLQQEIIFKHNGRIVFQSDDRLIAAFESDKQAENAIRAAFDVQNTILKLSAVNPESIELSIAVASGDATIAYMGDRENYFGPASKVIKALCDITTPGHIFIDRLTYELAGIHSLSASKDMVSVKGFKNPVQYYIFDQDTIVEISTDLTQQEIRREFHR